MSKDIAVAPLLAKVHPRGVITIPVQVRKQLRLETGDLIQFEEKGDFFIIKPVSVTVSVKLKR